MQHAFDSILTGLFGEMSSRQPSLSGSRLSVLLAVSGGIDSMCMAGLFKGSAAAMDFAVAHCNFSLRGKESDSDESLVSAWAERNGVKLHVKRFDTREFAAGKGLSIEMAARELRYGWFAGLCAEYGYDAVAVAHNANDNAETLFLNLLRGTGVRGLSGMKPLSPLPYSKAGMEPERGAGRPFLIRPLLSFTRKQIEGYVFAHKVSYRDDRTNFETEYKRNKVRNLVFPLLEQINPSFIRTVNREMEYFSQVGAIADDYYVSCPEGVFSDSGSEGGRADIAGLVALPHWEYLLFRFLDGYGFRPPVISSLADLLKSSRTVSGKVFRSENYTVVTSGTELIVSRNLSCPDMPGTEHGPFSRRRGTLPASFGDFPAGSAEVMTVHAPGDYFFNGLSFSVSLTERKSLESLAAPAGTLYFDARKMPFPFLCRKWMKGDWMVPLGMKGRKKISDLFTDLKFSVPDKSKAVMLVSPGLGTGSDSGHGHRVAAVLGVRSDNATRITDDTDNVLTVRIK